jgi:phytoene synthase
MQADLKASYAYCRHLNAVHGKTFYLATMLLPPAKRPHVHALYAFARYVDDRIDVTGDFDENDDIDDLVDARIRPALHDTLARYAIPRRYVEDFVASMRMDLTVTSYATYEDLLTYMWGSAAVVGLQMLPILGRASSATPWEEMERRAVDLGYAFQLTNFVRDVAEDLRRGRIYLPQDAMAAAGVTRVDLERGVVTGPIRQLLAGEIERARALYRSASGGVALVEPTSRDCLRTAIVLYGGILDVIEDHDYDVFSSRATVGLRHRATVAARGLVGAWSSRLRS